MANIVLIPPTFYNAKTYGAVGDGSADDTTAITNALGAASAAGGGVVFLPAMHAISSPISVPGNVTLQGGGQGTGVVMKSSFSGSTMLSLTGSYASVRDLVLQTPNATYSSNPAADGIQLTGVTDCILENLTLNNINGWAINSSGTSSVGNRRMNFINVLANKPAKGMQILGVSGSNYVGSHRIDGCNMDAVQSGDAYFIKDIHDVRAINILGECSAGTGIGMHLAGALGCFFTNVDLGGFSSNNAQPVIRINDSALNASRQLSFMGGIIEGGLVGAEIDGTGWGILFDGLAVYNNQSHGMNWTQSASGIVRACNFANNGQVAGTTYEIQTSTSGQVLITENQFLTPQGSGSGQVTAVINDTAGVATFLNNFMQGTGFSDSNFVASGGAPAVVRGYYPFLEGHTLTPPTFGASPFTAPTQSRDYGVYINGGTISDISIGGNTTNRTSGFFFVPAQQTIKVTFTVAPNWAWFRM